MIDGKESKIERVMSAKVAMLLAKKPKVNLIGADVMFPFRAKLGCVE
jgi:hypothetical protein